LLPRLLQNAGDLPYWLIGWARVAGREGVSGIGNGKFLSDLPADERGRDQASRDHSDR
jgi:hypothetical protein